MWYQYINKVSSEKILNCSILKCFVLSQCTLCTVCSMFSYYALFTELGQAQPKSIINIFKLI